MRCRSCHRRLSDPTSVSRGFGPVCWGRARKEAPGANGTANRPGYEYRFAKEPGCGTALVITELGPGGASVRNDIGAVLSRIAADLDTHIYFLAQCGQTIIYRDGEGNRRGVKMAHDGTTSFYELAAGMNGPEAGGTNGVMI